MSGRARGLLALVAVGGILAAVGAAILRADPRPRVRLVRAVMDLGGDRAAAALAAHVPDGVAGRLDLSYDPSDPDARYDLFRPARADGPLPTVVWIHGGAWVSGRKEHVANYLRILAAAGLTTVGLDYTTAPAATYPTPVRQVGRALAHLMAVADDHGIDPDRLVLAGDSAGAQLAAQVGTLLTNPHYAELTGIELPAAPRPCGVVLHCGAFDVGGFDPRSPLRRFLRDILWAYSGDRRGAAEPGFAASSVGPHVTGAFPSTFISVGDADPLAPQSVDLAARLEAAGVPVERLFFEGDDAAGLGHEYQFHLDRPQARRALDRSIDFIRRVTGSAPGPVPGPVPDPR